MSALLLALALHVVAPVDRAPRPRLPCDGPAVSPVRALTPPGVPASARPVVAPRRGARVLAVGPAMDGR
jgi:hypothetical protein